MLGKKMKDILTRMLAICLSVLMGIGSVPALARAEDGGLFSEGEYLMLADELYGENMDRLGNPMLGVLTHILGSIGGNMENRLWNTIWGAMFGEDNSSKEIISRLDEIERKLDQIIQILINLKNMLKEQSLEKIVDEKKQGMERANTVMRTAINRFEGRSQGDTLESGYTKEKGLALDIWFNFKPDGFQNSFYFFRHYCTMVAGTGDYYKTGTFEIYDQIADLKWNFDYEAAAFRQMEREADVHFVARMASLLTLWLEKERALGDESKEKENLDMYESMLRGGLQDVIDTLERRPVQLNDSMRSFHLNMGEQQASFSIYVGDRPDGGIAPLELKDTFRSHFVEDSTTERAQEAVRNLVEAQTPPTGTEGPLLRLITADELRVLQTAATARQTTIKQLLMQGANFPDGDYKYVAYGIEGEDNQALYFGSSNGPGSLLCRRDAYFRHADITNARDIFPDRLIGTVRVAQLNRDRFMISGDSSFDGYKIFFINGARYRVGFFEDNVFMPIWVTNSRGVPVTMNEPELADDSTSMTVSASIDQIEGGILSLTIPETSEQGVLWINDEVELSGVRDQQDAVGKLAEITFAVSDLENDSALSDDIDAPRYHVTRVALQEAAGESRTIEGEITAIDISKEILGRHPGITVAGEDGMLDIEAPLSGEIDIGVLVRVTFHTEDGINIADRLEIIHNPTPDDSSRVVDGEVTGIDTSVEILGKPPRFTVVYLGGEVELYAPYGLPEDMDVGAMVHAHYHDEEGARIADSIAVTAPADPEPLDPVPNPNPDDDPPLDPVPAPVFDPAWVEGYVMERLDDPSVLRFGQLRALVVSAAGQNFTLLLPGVFDLTEDVKVGAFVHVDYVAGTDGQNMVESITLLIPAPQSEDDPDPEPTDDLIDPVPMPDDGEYFSVNMP